MFFRVFLVCFVGFSQLEVIDRTVEDQYLHRGGVETELRLFESFLCFLNFFLVWVAKFCWGHDGHVLFSISFSRVPKSVGVLF